MGKVFTQKEVSGGKFPKGNAHVEAANFILDCLFVPQNSGFMPKRGLDSALLFGSILRSPSRRSDVDILIQYDPALAGEALPTIHKTLKAASHTFHTPLGASILHKGALDNPLEHNFDPIFLRHLAHVQDSYPEWSRCNPMPSRLLEEKIGRATLLDIAVAYCGDKTRRFARALAEPEGFNAQSMQRALELPGAIGRKVLAALQTLDDPIDIVRSTTDKVWTMQKTLNLLRYREPDNRTATKMSILHGLDQQYNTLLESTIEGDSSLRSYGSWLHGHYRPACQLAHDISYRFTEILRNEEPGHVLQES